MSESRLRRQKRQAREAYWISLSPKQRLQRAAAMTAAGRKLRAAGLALLGRESVVRDAPSRTRRK